MSIDESMKNAKAGIAIIGEVIKAAGENPQVREAGQQLGQTALTLTKTINNALIPLAAVNFAFEKARKYFADKFPSDMAAKAAQIPAEQVIEPKASIAGPALQGLAFSHEEENLKEMYLNLLASAMDARVASGAHPAFVEIVKQLSAEDARLVRGALQSKAGIPIVELRLNLTEGRGWNLLHRHLLNMHDTESKLPVEDPAVPAMVDNWIRLGLVAVDYNKHLSDESHYSWVENRPELKRCRETLEVDGKKVVFQKGLLVRTALGERFGTIVGLFEA